MVVIDRRRIFFNTGVLKPMLAHTALKIVTLISMILLCLLQNLWAELKNLHSYVVEKL